MNKILTNLDLANFLGFKTISDLKKKLRKLAKLNDYDCIYSEITKHQVKAFYSDNCKHQYQIGFGKTGMFTSRAI